MGWECVRACFVGRERKGSVNSPPPLSHSHSSSVFFPSFSWTSKKDGLLGFFFFAELLLLVRDLEDPKEYSQVVVMPVVLVLVMVMMVEKKIVKCWLSLSLSPR